MKKHVLILVLGAALACGSAMAAESVNVNTAQSSAIAKALGVGENIAARIVAEREENGRFKNAEDLAKRVRGLDAKVVERNKANIKI